jgi:hypothetical protein
MDGTTTSAADRRSAHRRVGAATVAGFLVLLLLGAGRGPAQAQPTRPLPAATAPPTVQPMEPRQTLPSEPRVPHDHDEPGPRGDEGGGFGGRGGGGSDGAAPAPSTGGSQT